MRFIRLLGWINGYDYYYYYYGAFGLSSLDGSLKVCLYNYSKQYIDVIEPTNVQKLVIASLCIVLKIVVSSLLDNIGRQGNEAGFVKTSIHSFMVAIDWMNKLRNIWFLFIGVGLHCPHECFPKNWTFINSNSINESINKRSPTYVEQPTNQSIKTTSTT